ncbi:MAG: hypothetical protein ACFE0O_08365 [Opitutales bacterium]
MLLFRLSFLLRSIGLGLLCGACLAWSIGSTARAQGLPAPLFDPTESLSGEGETRVEALTRLEREADRLRRAGDQEERARRHYLRALEAWAGSTQQDLARERFLRLIREASGFAATDSPGPALTLPRRIYRDAWSLAKTPAERSLCGFLLARDRLTASTGTPSETDAAQLEIWFAAATDPETPFPWVEQAHLMFAEWLMEQGRLVVDPEGGSHRAPDFARALEQFQAFLAKSRAAGKFPEPAQILAEEAIADILAPELAVVSDRSYLPDSEISLTVQWRNLESVDLALYQVRSTALTVANPRVADPLQAIGWEPGEALFRTRLDGSPEAPHAPLRETVRFAEPLPGGLYLAEVRSGDRVARDLVPVTRGGLFVRRLVDGFHIQNVDTESGEPEPDQPLRIFWRATGPAKEAWQSSALQTDASGQADWQPGPEWRSRSLDWLILAGEDEQVAVARASAIAPVATLRREAWTVMAQQAHYHPGDRVHWEAWLRGLPGKLTRLRPRLIDPEGRVVALPTPFLAGYQRVRGAFQLPADRAPAGQYRFFWDSAMTGAGLPPPPLLPFFHVCPESSEALELAITDVTRDSDGEGAVLEITIAGRVQGRPGPLGLAGRLLIRPIEAGAADPAQRSLMTCPALSHEAANKSGEAIPFELDAGGQARLLVPLAPDEVMGPDRVPLLVVVEARDDGGRPVRAQRLVMPPAPVLEADLVLDRTLGTPGEPVKLRLHTRLTDGQPVSVEGRLRILSRVWEEAWVNERGREITGRQYRELARRDAGLFRPFGGSAQDFRRVRSGYRSREIESRSVETDPSGVLEQAVVLPHPGFFRVQWTGQRPGGQLETAEADVLVGAPGGPIPGWLPDAFSLQVSRDDTGWQALVATPAGDGRIDLAWVHPEGEIRQTVRLSGHTRLVRQPDDLPEGPFRLVAWQWVQGTLFQAFADRPEDPLSLEVVASRDPANTSDGQASVLLKASGAPVTSWSAWLTLQRNQPDAPEPRVSRISRLAGGFHPGRDGVSSLQWKPFPSNGKQVGNPMAALDPSGRAPVLRYDDPVPSTAATPWLDPASPESPARTGTVENSVRIALPENARQPGATFHGLAYAADGRSRLLSRRLVSPFPLEYRWAVPERVRPGDQPAGWLDIRHRGDASVTWRLEGETATGETPILVAPDILLPGTSVQRQVPLRADFVALRLLANERLERLPVSIRYLPEMQPTRTIQGWGVLPGAGLSWDGPGSLLLAGSPPAALEAISSVLDPPAPESDPDLASPYLPLPIARALADPKRLTDNDLVFWLEHQNADGGWGLLPGEASHPVWTGLAYWALDRLHQRAEAGRLPDWSKGSLWRARRFLNRLVGDPEQPPGMRAWLAFCLSAPGQPGTVRTPRREEIAVFAELWRQRDRLEASALALLAQAADRFGLSPEARTLATLAAKRMAPDKTSGSGEPLRLSADRGTGPGTPEAGSLNPVAAPFRASTRQLITLWALHRLDPAHPLDPTFQPVEPEASRPLQALFARLLLNQMNLNARPLPEPAAFRLGEAAGIPPDSYRLETPGEGASAPIRLTPAASGGSGETPWLVWLAEPHPVVRPGIEVLHDVTASITRPTLLRGFRVDEVPIREVDALTVREAVHQSLTLRMREPVSRLTLIWPVPGGAVSQGAAGPELVAEEVGGTGRVIARDQGRTRADGSREAIWLELPEGTWRLEQRWRYPAPGTYRLPVPLLQVDGRPLAQLAGLAPVTLTVTGAPGQREGP